MEKPRCSLPMGGFVVEAKKRAYSMARKTYTVIKEMPRVLSPQRRLDPFHHLLRAIGNIQGRVSHVRRTIRERQKNQARKIQLVSRVVRKVEMGKLNIKRPIVVFEGIPFRRFRFAKKSDPEGNPPSSKDIEFLRGVTTGLREELEEIAQEEQELLSLYLTKVVSLFEYYVSEIFGVAFYNFNSLFNNPSELKRFFNKPIEKQLEFVKQQKLGFPYLNYRRDKAVEYIATRNVFIHNNGIIDEVYLKRVKNSNLIVNTKIKITYKYVYTATKFFLILARSLDDSLAKKVFKIEYLKGTFVKQRVPEVLRKFMRGIRAVHKIPIGRFSGIWGRAGAASAAPA